MYTCPKCKAKYDTHAFDSCPRCGLVSPEPVFCENCGAELESGALICPKCEAKTAWSQELDKALGKK